MELKASIEIDRPISEVWRFYAVDHVRNHPRWDPDMQLEQLTDGPIGIGTRIRRVNTRWGTPVVGEMEVIEFEPEHAMATVIHDANMDIQGRATVEERGPGRTLLAISADMPALDDPEKGRFIQGLMERSVANMKRLMESKT